MRQLRDRSYEVFAILLLDSQHRVIQFVEMFRGTIDSASVYPREVVSLVLEKMLPRSSYAIIIRLGLQSQVSRIGE